MRAAVEDRSEASGERLTALLDRAERASARRNSALSLDELRELGRLYRANAGRLARLRSSGDDPERIRHLNALAVRAYALLYATRETRREARAPLAETMARALGRGFAPLVLAALLLVAGCAIGLVLGLRDADAVPSLMPSGLGYGEVELDVLLRSPDARAAFLTREETPVSHNTFFGSYLFAHNTRVGVLAFASGILAGIPTVLLQLYNGIMLGVFASIFLRDPMPLAFLAWILPHGIPELTAITLCAAAGLALGAAVVAPGRAGRRAALREAAASALVLVGMAVPLLLLAALMESFVRESLLGTTTRLALAGGELVLLGAGLAWMKRLARLAHCSTPDTGWLVDLSPARAGSPDSGRARSS